MYSKKAINEAARKVEETFPVRLREYTPSEVDAWVERINSAITLKGENKLEQKRPLDEEERQFISNELLMSKISFPYYAERYVWIRRDKGGDVRFKFWESQELILDTIAKMQDAGLPIFLINLKARQIGASTLAEAILTHKVLTTPSITSLLAADEAKQSEFLFNMMERVFNHLPLWMRPHRLYHVKGAHMFFDRMDSNVLVDAGNKRDGNVGQGKALHCGHLSELATWQNPEMVSEDLIPAILSAASPHSFWIFESTAKGKMSHWRDWWLAAKRGRFHGFVPVFVAWWVIKEKYQADPSIGWEPSDRVRRLARTLLLLKGVELTRKQMYWWDRTYASYKEENRLNAFYAEYASDDEEAFQLTGKSVFPIETIQDLRRKAMERTTALYQFEERGLDVAPHPAR